MTYIGTADQIRDIFDNYVECLLWQAHCDGEAAAFHDDCRGEDCDTGLDDCEVTMSAQAELSSMQDIVGFLKSCQDERPDAFSGLDAVTIGHNFMLTREGHGTGFWDRGLGEQGEYLTTMCKVYGEAGVYVHGGEVYVS